MSEAIQLMIVSDFEAQIIRCKERVQEGLN